jgi:glycosyltransferase involved in cell wall biosynthesis
MSPVRIPENVGDFRLVDRRAVDVLRQLPERNRFMKGLFAWVGFNSIGVPYERPQRAAGSSKFNLWRLWNFALDGVVSFSTAPLRAWFYVGVVIAAVSVLYALFIITRVLIFGIDTPGYASLLIAVLLMGAIQLLSLGIIGEYLGRLFLEVKGRPIYVVEGVYEDEDIQAPKR